MKVGYIRVNNFTILLGDDLMIYNKFEDIPEEITAVISFLPDIPPPPHTEEQHEEIDTWMKRFREVMRRENTYASSN
jgi:hypothetical protein